MCAKHRIIPCAPQIPPFQPSSPHSSPMNTKNTGLTLFQLSCTKMGKLNIPPSCWMDDCKQCRCQYFCSSTSSLQKQDTLGAKKEVNRVPYCLTGSINTCNSWCLSNFKKQKMHMAMCLSTGTNLINMWTLREDWQTHTDHPGSVWSHRQLLALGD